MALLSAAHQAYWRCAAAVKSFQRCGTLSIPMEMVCVLMSDTLGIIVKICKGSGCDRVAG